MLFNTLTHNHIHTVSWIKDDEINERKITSPFPSFCGHRPCTYTCLWTFNVWQLLTDLVKNVQGIFPDESHYRTHAISWVGESTSTLHPPPLVPFTRSIHCCNGRNEPSTGQNQTSEHDEMHKENSSANYTRSASAYLIKSPLFGCVTTLSKIIHRMRFHICLTNL